MPLFCDFLVKNAHSAIQTSFKQLLLFISMPYVNDPVHRAFLSELAIRVDFLQFKIRYVDQINYFL